MDLSKEAQLGRKIKKYSKKEKDEASKLLYCCLTVAWNHMDEVDILFHGNELDHIDNKGSHCELRYLPSNQQLIDWRLHQKKTDSGLHTDFRDSRLKAFMKQFDKLMR
jgi:hypothetical protein